MLLGAHLEQATIVCSRLIGAVLTNAHLQKADLSDSDLRRADLRRADLREATLHRTDLREANLAGANLAQASLLQTDLRSARSDDATRWPASFDPEAAGVIHDGGQPRSITSGRMLPRPEPSGTPGTRPVTSYAVDAPRAEAG